MSEGHASRQMPRYKCHKEVWALKIEHVAYDIRGDGSAVITPSDEGYGLFEVDAEYVNKHLKNRDPKNGQTIGGYYVVYDDGYKSFSPAKAFEEGYTRK